jgi:drug/metabolite transporter (DMT)-like permease
MPSLAIKGYIFALLGVIILSPDALLIRLAGDEPLLISAFRGTLGGCMVLLYNQLLDRRNLFEQLRRVGLWWVLTITFFNGISQIGFVYGVSHANAADVLVIIAFAPLMSAFLSAIFLGERISLRTWVATSVCGIGLAILFGQSGSSSEWSGLLAAVICAVSMATVFVIMRGFPNENLTGCVGFGNIFSGLACASVVLLTTTGEIGHLEWMPMALMILVVSPIPFVLFVLALRHISAAETSLILLLESVLGSFWIWLVVSEQPSTQTLLAGTLVISTLMVYSWMGLRDSRRRAKAIIQPH